MNISGLAQVGSSTIFSHIGNFLKRLSPFQVQCPYQACWEVSQIDLTGDPRPNANTGHPGTSQGLIYENEILPRSAWTYPGYRS
jgi:hypothetical protein